MSDPTRDTSLYNVLKSAQKVFDLQNPNLTEDEKQQLWEAKLLKTARSEFISMSSTSSPLSIGSDGGPEIDDINKNIVAAPASKRMKLVGSFPRRSNPD